MEGVGSGRQRAQRSEVNKQGKPQRLLTPPLTTGSSCHPRAPIDCPRPVLVKQNVAFDYVAQTRRHEPALHHVRQPDKATVNYTIVGRNRHYGSRNTPHFASRQHMPVAHPVCSVYQLGKLDNNTRMPALNSLPTARRQLDSVVCSRTFKMTELSSSSPTLPSSFDLVIDRPVQHRSQW